MTHIIQPHRHLDIAIANILSGEWVDPKLRAFLAPSYADKVEAIKSGYTNIVRCACGRVRTIPVLGAASCVSPCNLLFVATYRHVLVSWGLDPETEEKMIAIMSAFPGTRKRFKVAA